jgi:hypothetical protein
MIMHNQIIEKVLCWNTVSEHHALRLTAMNLIPPEDLLPILFPVTGQIFSWRLLAEHVV